MLGTYKEANTGTGQKEPNQRPERFGQRLGGSRCGLVRYADTLLKPDYLLKCRRQPCSYDKSLRRGKP